MTYNMHFKSNKEIRDLSPEALIEEKQRLLRQRKQIFDTAAEWMAVFKFIQREMQDRVDYFEYEMLQAEQDRGTEDLADFDILFNIH